MKKSSLLFAVALLTFGAGAAQTTPRSAGSPDESHSERRQERIERLAARTAEYIHYVDSLVESRSFSFVPLTFQMQPAGSLNQITNTGFQLIIYPTWIDVYLPYIKGITPPYYFTVINYALPKVDNYQAVRTPAGWKVTFSSSMFSSDTYNYELDIISATGSSTLTIATPLYNTVQYSGQLFRN
jgi:hypothetical protein